MNFFKKWYTYQKERFPVLVYGAYILCIVVGVFFYYISYGKQIENKVFLASFNNSVGPYHFDINYLIMIPMFAVAFLQFLMVRIIDEFKDYEEDCKYRPYRPVPRGLISLKELKILFLICAVLQVGITYMFNKFYSIIWLAILWIFFLLMTKGFFIKKILDKHILLEVLLDELMLPILIIYLVSFIYYKDFSILKNLLFMGYIISCIVEIARKVRCKEDEEEGVKTYTAVFGIPKAVCILAIFETLLTLVLYSILGKAYLLPIIIIYTVINLINILFMIEQRKKYAKATELSANIFIMLAYLSMGFLIL